MAKLVLDRTEKLMRQIAGKPRAAIVAVWPVLDSHCMAGVALINRNRARAQKLPVEWLPVEFDPDHIRWTLDAGFINGLNVPGHTPSEALQNLYDYLVAEQRRSAKMQREQAIERGYLVTSKPSSSG